jgi:tetratricopeptide (TPR) repeat protein
MPDEWFRKTTWSSKDQEDFERRFSRSRRTSRAQYLRIQALHLAQSGEHAAALVLLSRMLSEYPDRVQEAAAHLQCAQSLIAIGQHADAIDAFRAALATERSLPNVRTNAWLEFAWYVADRKLAHYYREALGVLDERARDEAFPVQRFRSATARTLIEFALGNLTLARESARVALAAAAERHSGMAKHPTLGLVSTLPEDLVARLRRLAG